VYSFGGPCKLTLLISRNTAAVDSAILRFDSYQTGLGVNEDQADLPHKIELLQNYPNPFNPSTVIRFEIPTTSHVSLKIYDVIGKEVAVLVNGDLSAGYHSCEWNASAMSSGMYFYRLVATLHNGEKKESFTQIRKLLLAK
jgi:hypothetical protein